MKLAPWIAAACALAGCESQVPARRGFDQLARVVTDVSVDQNQRITVERCELALERDSRIIWLRHCERSRVAPTPAP